MRIQKQPFGILFACLILMMLAFSVYLINKLLLDRPRVVLPEFPREDELPRHTSMCGYPGNLIRLMPGCETIFDGVWVRLPLTHISINSYGYRDYEYTVRKPEGVCRIAVVGDSVTFGHGVELDQTFVKFLERRLNRRNKRKLKYEIMNFGVSGANIKEKAEIFLKKAMPFGPDMLILQYHEDDWFDRDAAREFQKKLISERYPDFENGPETPERRIERLELEYKAYGEYINFAEKNEDIENYMNRHISGILTMVRENHIEMAIVSWMISDKSIKYIRHICEKEGCRLLQIPEGNDQAHFPNLFLHPKDSHPSASGHRLMAERLADFLAQNFGF